MAEVRLVASAEGRGGGRAGGLGAEGLLPASPAGGTEAGGACAMALDSVTSARSSMTCPHLRHFIRTVLPATLSSAIWYFALHCSQKNFTGKGSEQSHYPKVTLPRKPEAPRLAQISCRRCCLTDSRVASSGARAAQRSHISTALFLNPAFS